MQPTTFYKHYKNKPYRFLSVVKHSETLEDMVLYETLYKNSFAKLWVRPKDMFFEILEKDGHRLPRFAPVPLDVREYDELDSKRLAEIIPVFEKVFGSFDQKEFIGRIDGQKRIHLALGFLESVPVGFKIGYELEPDTFYSWLGGVDPQYRGLGVARQLVQAQHLWCEKAGYTRIRTKTKNQFREMIILNLKSGFSIIGTYIDKHGEPKLILEKQFKETSRGCPDLR